MSTKYFRQLFFVLGSCIYCLNAGQANAQSYAVKHYSTSEGLSHSNVFRIFQDTRGFIWFSTDEGLSCFDSKSFTNYYTADGLSDDCIMSVTESPAGQLYISTYRNGISIKNDSVIKKLTIEDSKMPLKIFSSFISPNNIWFIGEDDITSLFHIRNNHLKKWEGKDKQGERIIIQKGYEHDNTLFLATNHGIFFIDKTQEVKPFMPDLIKGSVTAMEIDRKGKIWVGQTHRLICIHNGQIRKDIKIKPKTAISDILTDKKEGVWVSIIGEGVCKVQNNDLINMNKTLGINTHMINDLFEDRDGSVWIATHGDGVYKLDFKYINLFPLKNKLLNVYSTAVTPFGASIFVGSLGTLSILKNNKLLPFPLHYLEAVNYIYFVEIINEQLYVGTPHGLIRKDLKYPFREKLILQNNHAATGIISIYKDSEGRIWAGGFNQLYQVSGENIIKVNTNINKILRINVIHEDNENNIWFGTNKGLIKFDGNTFSEVKISGSDTAPPVISIYPDNKTLWIGTTNGITKLNKGAILCTIENGLKIRSMIKDSSHTLWLGTSKGLKYIANGTSVIKDCNAFPFNDEILKLHIQNNRLFVGTIAGLFQMEIDQTLSLEGPALPTYITSVTTQDKTIAMPGRIRLPYNHNKLIINFIGLNFTNPGYTEYRYRIRNLDEIWHMTTNNSIELSSMPYGSYNFELESRIRGERWGSTQVLEIQVNTPIWRQWWFIALLFVGTVVILYALLRNTINRREKKKRRHLMLQNKINQLKQQALNALINPHFIFNCMNSIQYYINENDNDLANEYLSRFARLIRMTLEHSMDSFIDLGTETERIKLYLSLEQLRFDDNLKWQLFVSDTLQNKGIKIPNMILQPYIENAIWHGIMPKEGPGEIIINMEKSGEANLKITIRDNGAGIDFDALKQNNKNKSLGMKLIAERLALLKEISGRDFSVKVKKIEHILTTPSAGTTKNTGTIVELLLPLISSRKESMEV